MLLIGISRAFLFVSVCQGTQSDFFFFFLDQKSGLCGNVLYGN